MTHSLLRDTTAFHNLLYKSYVTCFIETSWRHGNDVRSLPEFCIQHSYH